ncbi:translation initiation factor IF-2-like [Dryobates pubescens]|uniref:translation initiation factor IF-2-like n=1 Tax=Dryobates pubescens TaxID=118200 RepID=UPI0023B8C615|nr:translation initiation factor IF-2-like [Dryobates pubescens]
MTFPSLLGPASNPWRRGEVALSPSCRRKPSPRPRRGIPRPLLGTNTPAPPGPPISSQPAPSQLGVPCTFGDTQPLVGFGPLCLEVSVQGSWWFRAAFPAGKGGREAAVPPCRALPVRKSRCFCERLCAAPVPGVHLAPLACSGGASGWGRWERSPRLSPCPCGAQRPRPEEPPLRRLPIGPRRAPTWDGGSPRAAAGGEPGALQGSCAARSGTPREGRPTSPVSSPRPAAGVPRGADGPAGLSSRLCLQPPGTAVPPRPPGNPQGTERLQGSSDPQALVTPKLQWPPQAPVTSPYSRGPWAPVGEAKPAGHQCSPSDAHPCQPPSALPRRPGKPGRAGMLDPIRGCNNLAGLSPRLDQPLGRTVLGTGQGASGPSWHFGDGGVPSPCLSSWAQP